MADGLGGSEPCTRPLPRALAASLLMLVLAQPTSADIVSLFNDSSCASPISSLGPAFTTVCLGAGVANVGTALAVVQCTPSTDGKSATSATVALFSDPNCASTPTQAISASSTTCTAVTLPPVPGVPPQSGYAKIVTQSPCTPADSYYVLDIFATSTSCAGAPQSIAVDGTPCSPNGIYIENTRVALLLSVAAGTTDASPFGLCAFTPPNAPPCGTCTATAGGTAFHLNFPLGLGMCASNSLSPVPLPGFGTIGTILSRAPPYPAMPSASPAASPSSSSSPSPSPASGSNTAAGGSSAAASNNGGITVIAVVVVLIFVLGIAYLAWSNRTRLPRVCGGKHDTSKMFGEVVMPGEAPTANPAMLAQLRMMEQTQAQLQAQMMQQQMQLQVAQASQQQAAQHRQTQEAQAPTTFEPMPIRA